MPPWIGPPSIGPSSIGVMVPNYNYARYLAERLGSIGAQTRTPAALIFLDDASTDDSWARAAPLLAALPCRVTTHRNATRVGRVLRQWQAGLALLDTDLVWIAEADDRAQPGFLVTLEARLLAEPEALFAFCDSAPIDAEGQRTGKDSKAYYAALGDTILGADTLLDSEQFASRCLCPRNLVLNVSAVLWRRAALERALARIGNEADSWHNAADWRVYAEACTQPGRVIYVSTPLNEHRRHAGSVTGATPAMQHYGEVVTMLTRLRDSLGADPARDALMRAHLAELRRLWRLLPSGQPAA